MAVTVNFNTIRQRASQFAKKFEGVTSEKSRDQDFMRGFCALFGINPSRIDWQFPLKEINKVTKKTSTIWADGFLRGTLLIEMKSAGKDLDEAYKQASAYVLLMNEKDLPDYILVSDFANLHLYNRKTGAPRIELKLADLPQQIEPFLFLANYEAIAIEQQEYVNKAAAETLAKLPYINGQLFAGNLAECCFDEDVRKTLIECAKLDWSQISPAIFGSLFQAIMHFEDETPTARSKKRREFGAHYTSE